IAPPAGKASATDVYPEVTALPAGGGAWHGYQLASVRVYPVRYAHAARRLSVATSVDLTLDLEPGAAMPLQRARFRPDLDADAARELERRVVNPEAILGYDRRLGQRVEKTRPGFNPTEAPSLEGSEVDYVVVTSQALAPAWQVFADSKTQRGVPTVVRTVEWIQ